MASRNDPAAIIIGSALACHYPVPLIISTGMESLNKLSEKLNSLNVGRIIFVTSEKSITDIETIFPRQKTELIDIKEAQKRIIQKLRAPRIKNITPSPQMIGRPIRFTAGVTDEISGIKDVYLKIEDKPKKITMTYNPKIRLHVVEIPAILRPLTIEYRIISNDNAGNRRKTKIRLAADTINISNQCCLLGYLNESLKKVKQRISICFTLKFI